MAGAGIEIGATLDDAGAKAVVDRLVAAGADLAPVMDAIGRKLVANTELRFDEDQASPGGVPWIPSLRAKIQGGKTLVDTARLRGSITHRASRSQVEVGTNVLYAAVHQFGATIRPKRPGGKLRFTLADGTGVVTDEVTIPARPFLGVGPDDAADILDMASIALRGMLGP